MHTCMCGWVGVKEEEEEEEEDGEGGRLYLFKE